MNLLILSIGSNPMPNFITAKYLLDENRVRYEKTKMPIPHKILFVYSSNTEKFKKSIVKQLGISKNSIKCINLGEEQRNFDKIKKKVSKKIGKKDPFEIGELGNLNSIHLNYTGGTKVMAVAISEAVRECEHKTIIYSDLSYSDFQLTLRNGDSYPTIDSINKFVELSIEGIYDLHCLEKPDFKKENSEFYSDKFVRFLFSKVQAHKNKDKDFYDKLWDIKFDKKNKEDLLNSIGKVYTPSKVPLTKKDFESLKKFICGDWLEEYVFATLTEIKVECGITDLAWNIKAKIKKNSNRDFEIDVIAIKGCKSFVFTCTTDYSSGICKGKAFEGIYRSEQLGGEHSKTILVCLADDYGGGHDNETVKNIEIDMSQFNAAENFTILGSDDISNKADFKDKLIEIIGCE